MLHLEPATEICLQLAPPSSSCYSAQFKVTNITQSGVNFKVQSNIPKVSTGCVFQASPSSGCLQPNQSVFVEIRVRSDNFSVSSNDVSKWKIAVKSIVSPASVGEMANNEKSISSILNCKLGSQSSTSVSSTDSRLERPTLSVVPKILEFSAVSGSDAIADVTLKNPSQHPIFFRFRVPIKSELKFQPSHIGSIAAAGSVRISVHINWRSSKLQLLSSTEIQIQSIFVPKRFSSDIKAAFVSASRDQISNTVLKCSFDFECLNDFVDADVDQQVAPTLTVEEVERLLESNEDSLPPECPVFSANEVEDFLSDASDSNFSKEKQEVLDLIEKKVVEWPFEKIFAEINSKYYLDDIALSFLVKFYIKMAFEQFVEAGRQVVRFFRLKNNVSATEHVTLCESVLSVTRIDDFAKIAAPYDKIHELIQLKKLLNKYTQFKRLAPRLLTMFQREVLSLMADYLEILDTEVELLSFLRQLFCNYHFLLIAKDVRAPFEFLIQWATGTNVNISQWLRERVLSEVKATLTEPGLSELSSVILAVEQLASKLEKQTRFVLIEDLRATVKNFLEPTIVQLVRDNEKVVLEVKSKFSLVISAVYEQIKQILQGKEDIEEVRFIAARFIHVDADFQQSLWHGRNIVLSTAGDIHVHGNVTWDVSGRPGWSKDEVNSQPLFITGDIHVKRRKAPNGIESGSDGQNGKHGLPGESGGNVAILARKIVSGENWKVRSNGGTGQPGQTGGDGVAGKKGEDGAEFRSLAEFKQRYPPWTWTIAKRLAEDAKEFSVQWDTSFLSNSRIHWEGFFSDGQTFIYGHCNFDNAKIVGAIALSPIIFGVGCLIEKGNSCEYMLVKGAPGKAGQLGGRGGLGGYGGHGGLHGQLLIQLDQSNATAAIDWGANDGNHGDSGSTGLSKEDGLMGKNGRDFGHLTPSGFRKTREKGPDFLNLNKEEQSTEDNARAPYYDSPGNEMYVSLQVVSAPSRAERPVDQRAEQRHEKDAESPVSKKAISIASVQSTYQHQTEVDQLLERTNSFLDLQKQCLTMLSELDELIEETDQHQATFERIIPSLRNAFTSASELERERKSWLKAVSLGLDKSISAANSRAESEELKVNKEPPAIEFDKLQLAEVVEFVHNNGSWCREVSKEPLIDTDLEKRAETHKVRILLFSCTHSDDGLNPQLVGVYNAESGEKTVLLLKRGANRFSQLGIDDGVLKAISRLAFLGNKTTANFTDPFAVLQNPPSNKDDSRFAKFFPVTEQWNSVKWYFTAIAQCDQFGLADALFSRFLDDGCLLSNSCLRLFSTLTMNAMEPVLSENDDRPHLIVFSELLWLVHHRLQADWFCELITVIARNYTLEPNEADSFASSHLEKIPDRSLGLLAAKLETMPREECGSISLADFLEVVRQLANLSSENADVYCILDQTPLSEWAVTIRHHHLCFNVRRKFENCCDGKLSSLAKVAVSLLDSIASDEDNNQLGLMERFAEALASISCVNLDDVSVKVLKRFIDGELKFDENFFASFSKNPAKFAVADPDYKPVERLVDEILGRVKKDENTSVSCTVLDSVGEFVLSVKVALGETSKLPRVDDLQLPTFKINEYSDEDVKKWTAVLDSLDKDVKTNEHMAEMAAVVIRAIKLKFNFYLRDAQLFTLGCFLKNNPRKTLAQVSTGEGKSAIVTSLAIIQSLLCRKMTVDVVTSSSVLAERDAQEQLPVYKLFAISVSHNCEDSADVRKQAYTCQVVYGEVSSFQRDYLLHTFYGENVLGDRCHSANVDYHCVIVDEVDSMLLDKGNNVLYLSHSLPDFDKLEGLYMYIWQLVTTKLMELAGVDSETMPNEDELIASIRQPVLENLHNVFDKEALRQLLGNQVKDDSLRDLLWNQLVKAGLINNGNGYILCRSVSELQKRFESIVFDEKVAEDLKDELLFLLTQSMQLPKNFETPQYLTPFIERHLNTWIKSAFQAVQLKNGRDYVLGHDSKKTSGQVEPNVIIVDTDTGTDQSNSQWNEGLHQFLQLKHRCRLSVQYLKAVFISNTKFFADYRYLYGLTGTLGSKAERNLLKSIYEIDYITVPTALPKRFFQYPRRLVANQTEWLQEVAESALEMASDRSRSVLIVCESINDTVALHAAIQNHEMKTENVKLNIYNRDYQTLEAASSSGLGPGQIIVATNLAGRGTDLKISDQLDKAGGLHVLLTYLPSNERIEEQAFGRAARKGNQGSGQMLVKYSSPIDGDEDIDDSLIELLVDQRNLDEAARISEIKKFYNESIALEEKLFDSFKHKFLLLKSEMQAKDPTTQVLLGCCLDNWALWLDEVDSKLRDPAALSKKLEEELFPKMTEITAKCYQAIDSPSSLIKVALCLIKSKSKNFVSEAMRILDMVIEKEPNFCEFAHYFKSVLIVKEDAWEIERSWIGNFDRVLEMRRRLKRTLYKALDAFEAKQQRDAYYSGTISQISLVVDRDSRNQLVMVDSYKHQKTASIDLYNLFVKSIHDMLGTHAITEDQFEDLNSTSTSNSTSKAKEAIFKQLRSCDIVKPAKAKKHVADADLAPICAEFGIKLQELKSYLKNNPILDENSITISLRKAFPSVSSREEFWKLLIKHGVLENEKKYVLINPDQPSQSDLAYFVSNYDHKDKKYELGTDDGLLVFDQLHANNSKHFLVYDRKVVKDKLTGLSKWQTCKQNGTIRLNSVAKVNVEMLKSFSSSSLLNKAIDPDEFASVSSMSISSKKSKEIYEYLVKIGLLDLTTGKLIDVGLDVASDDFVAKLGKYGVYRSEIGSLLVHRFGYAFELEQMKKYWLSGADKGQVVSMETATSDGEQNQSAKPQFQFSLPIKPHSELAKIVVVNSRIFCQFRVNKKHGEDLVKAVKKALDPEMLSRDFKVWPDKEFLESIAESLNGQQGVTAKDTPDAVLKPLIEVIAGGDHFKYGSELQILASNGVECIVVLEEKRYTFRMWVNCIFCALIGVCQIVAGVILEVFTAGAGTYIASGLISEGVGDILYSAECAYNGYFTWAAYGSYKWKSVVVTAISGGLAAWASRSSQLSRIGRMFGGQFKSICGKKLLEETAKTTIKGASVSVLGCVMKRIGGKLVETVVQGGLNLVINATLDKGLSQWFDSISSKIVGQLYETVDAHMTLKANMEKLYKLNPQEAPQRVIAWANGIVGEEWFVDQVGKYLSKFASVVTRGLGDAMKKIDRSGGKVAKSMAILVKVLEYAQKACDYGRALAKIAAAVTLFLDSLCNKISQYLSLNSGLTNDSTNSKTFEERDFKVFQCDVTAQLKVILERQVSGDIRNRIAHPLMQSGASMMMTWMKKIKTKAWRGIQTHRANRILDGAKEKLNTVLEAHDDGSGSPEQNSAVAKAYEEFGEKLVYLAAISKDSKFHARLVREGGFFDPVCIQAYANVFGVPIQVTDNSTGEVVTYTPVEGCAEGTQPISVALDDLHFTSDIAGGQQQTGGGLNTDCFVKAVAPGEDPAKIRESVASWLENNKDPRIDEQLRSHAHRFMVANRGFIGGAFRRPRFNLFLSKINAGNWTQHDTENLIKSSNGQIGLTGAPAHGDAHMLDGNQDVFSHGLNIHNLVSIHHLNPSCGDKTNHSFFDDEKQAAHVITSCLQTTAFKLHMLPDLQNSFAQPSSARQPVDICCPVPAGVNETMLSTREGVTVRVPITHVQMVIHVVGKRLHMQTCYPVSIGYRRDDIS